MEESELTNWLLFSDVSIQYQVYRDFLGVVPKDLQKRIANEEWGKSFLNAKKPNVQRSAGCYRPKWTTSHYTLIDLCNLGTLKIMIFFQ